MSFEVANKTRSAPEHKEGYLAYEKGYVDDDCPHDRGDSRLSWLCGWYDARRMDKFGHLFEEELELYSEYLS